MCDQCDKRVSEEGHPVKDDSMPLGEAVRIAAGVRHRPDGTSRAFDALLRELDRLNEEKNRWDALTGRKENNEVKS